MKLPASALLIVVALNCACLAGEPPRPWPPDPFRPLTAERIAALSPAEHAAWDAYWRKSAARNAALGPRDLADRSPTAPLAGAPIGAVFSKGARLNEPEAWFASADARRTAGHILSWQTSAGGWAKGGDYSRDRRPEDDHHNAWSAGTYDNDATLLELRFLARVVAAQPDAAEAAAWRDGFARGLDYILDSQYPNGGLPQIYPLVGGYHDAITFNDDAMLHVLEFLRDIARNARGFEFVPPSAREAARAAVERGTACILSTQLRDATGALTVWCQQYDPLERSPCAARNFEPAAECSRESVGLVRFLMEIESPPPAVVAAVHGAMRWFEAHALSGVVWDRDAPAGTDLGRDAAAPPLWARFYEFGTGRPIFGERDRTIHYSITEISFERRKGYMWFTPLPGELRPVYARWSARHPDGT